MGLIDEVTAVIPQMFDGALVDLVADTGAAGLCVDATVELIKLLGRGEHMHLDLTRGRVIVGSTRLHDVSLHELYGEQPPYPNGESQEHAVAVIDGFAVDLTARQYDETLPFPFIWPW